MYIIIIISVSSSIVWLTERPLQGAEIMDAGIGFATDDFTIGSACRYLVEEMNLHCDDTGGFHCRYPSSGGVD